MQGTQVFEEHTAAFFAVQSVFPRQATQVCEVGLHLGAAGPQSLSVLHWTQVAGDGVVRHLFSGVKWQSVPVVQGTQTFDEHFGALFKVQCEFEVHCTHTFDEQ